MQKRHIYMLLGWLMLFGWQQSFAQTDTLCNPNENKKIFGELYFNYGSSTNAYSQFNRSTHIAGQPFVTPQNMLSQSNQGGFGVYSPWYLPPQPPILVATQGDFKDRIKISWNVNPLSPSPAGFVLYRDGSFLADLGENVRDFLDFNTQAGEYYEYSIEAKNVFGTGSPSKAVGFVNPNGVVSGKIETNSGNPVPNVEVRLTPLTGNSMAFDGVNDELCVSYHEEFPTEKFTVSAYVKLDTAKTVNNEGAIIDWGSSLNKNWWITTTTSGEAKGFIFHIGNGTSSDTLKYYLPNPATNPENVNNWHQITMVYNGSALSVLVDGEFIGTKPASIVREKSYLNIGSKIGSGGFFKGKIDDIRVYNRPLTQTEVNSTKKRSVSKSEKGLVSYWKMDEGIGSKVFDNTTIPTNANIYGATFSADKPEVYSAGVTDVTGYYVIDGINYSQVESFRATPMKNFDFNSSVEFNAADKSYGNLTDFDMPDTSTVELLFYPFDLKSRQTVASKGSLYEAYIDNGKLFLNLNGTTTDLGTIKAKFYHLAVTLDNTAGSAKIYLEGELSATVSFGGTSNWKNGKPWLLATNDTTATTGKFYTGLVDEFYIYKTALPQNVIQIHQGFGVPKDSTTAMLYSHFDLNEASDTLVYDYAIINFGAENPRIGSLKRASWSNNARRKETKPHEFEPNVRVVNLNTSNTAIGSIDFKDVSTVNVSGYVRFANTFCFEDKVEILVNGQPNFPSIITDADGKWSADFEPGRSIKLSAVYKGHLFGPGFFEIRKIQSPRAGILFLDNTKRTIRGQVAGGNCRKSIIPSGAVVIVKVRTLDGCFERQDTLRNPDGRFVFNDLPARAFTVSIIEHSNPVISGYFNTKGGYEVDLRDSTSATRDFIYFSPLVVEATKPRGIACDESGYPVLPIGLHPTKIKVYEEYDGGKCYLESAELLIKDRVTGMPDSTVTFSGGEFVYKFYAGNPNVLPPFTKTLEIKASVPDGREADLVPAIEVISLGEKSRGGNTFTSTTPPVIMDIIRDPPGDASYAWREAGTTNCVSYTSSVTKNYGNSQGLFASVSPTYVFSEGLGFTVGKELEVIGNSTQTWTKNKTYNNGVEEEICYTNNETITTSASEDFIGPDGDVFIGSTFNIVWGVSDELVWDSDSCKIDKNAKLSVDNDGFNSTFQYSRHYIQNTLLPELLRLANSPYILKKDSTDAMNAYNKWVEELANEDKLKKLGYSQFSKILTMDAGTTYQEVISEEISETKTFNYAYEYNFDSENSLGILFGGIGGSFNFGFNYNVTSEGSKSTSGTSSKAYGYFISDDDQGDAHAIGIKYAKQSLNTFQFNSGDASELEQAINDESDGYNYSTDESVFTNIGSWVKDDFKLPNSLLTEKYSSPLFVLLAGTTSCPYEAGRARDKVYLEATPTQRLEVPANAAAVYTLKLGNESPSEETRTYLVKLVNESNPDGAIVKINGVTIGGTPIPITTQYGNILNQTLTIEKGPVKYDYTGIKIAFYAECDYAEDDAADLDSAYLASGFYTELAFNASFVEPCSPVDISYPLQDWVLTPAQGDSLSITLIEYNKNDPDLKQIRLQYRPTGGDGSWINIIDSISVASLGNVFTIKKWGSALNRDGAYEIRAVAECTNPNLAPGISTVIQGEIARTPPELFGVPEPGDGTWDPGDEISITFNEPIDCEKVFQATIQDGNNTIGLYDATTNALVDATITCVGNKIIITPVIDDSYENRTFRVVVSGKDYDDAKLAQDPNILTTAAIRDKAGNRIPETIKWEFAYNQNNLEWVGTDVIETNEVLKPFTVKRQIRNRGGSIASFRMESIPSWLTVSPTTGTLNPGQVADVTLTFQQDLLIGDYLDTLQMVGSRGKEPLLIDYRVRCPQPAYVVDNPSQYEGSMNMVVDLSIFNVKSKDPSDVVVAKIDGQVRGVGRVQYYRNIPTEGTNPDTGLPDDSNRWLTFLTIFGNSSDIDKPIEFAIWDGDKCNEYVEVLEQITYQEGGLVGSPLEPQPIHVLNLVKKCIPLNRGFNWVSFNLNLGAGNNTFTKVLSSLKNKTGTSIKTDDNFADYFDGTWYALNDVVLPTKRYLVYVAGIDTVCIKGEPYKAVDFAIPMKAKPQWNWLGYVPSTGMTVTQALKGLTPLNGDIIKSQTLFAQYVAGTGWIGNLNFLEPLKGYMLKISNTGTLRYQTGGTNGAILAGIPTLAGADNLQIVADEPINSVDLLAQEAQEAPMVYDFTKYQSNMNLIGKVNGITIDPDDELRAYIDGKLVGVNKSIANTGNRLFFQTIYHEDELQVSFKLFKADRKKEYELTRNIQFKADALAGLVEDPIIFELTSTNLPLVTIAIADQIIKQPDQIFTSVSIPNSIAENNAACSLFAINTILPSGTETKPTCTAQTLEANMTSVIKVKFNELSSFVSSEDVLSFVDPATGATVGCGVFLPAYSTFFTPIAGAANSTVVPLDVIYYSNTMKKTFRLKAGVNYRYNVPLGTGAAPHVLDFSPLAVNVSAAGDITAVMRDTSWTGNYCVNAFAMNCNGLNDGQTSFCFRRLKSNDCSYSFSTPSSNTPVCKGSTINLSSNKGTSYSWVGPNSFTSTLQNPQITAASSAAGGIYTSTVTSYRCAITATASVTVKALTMTASSNTPVCETSTLSLSSSGGSTYLWAGPNSFTSTLQNPEITAVSSAASGTYTVTMTGNGCTDTATTNVFVKLLPTIALDPTVSVCENSTLTLYGNGGTGYLWTGPNSFSSTSQIPQILNASSLMAGSYTLNVTLNGCTASSSQTIIVKPLPIKPSITGSEEICASTPTVLSVSDAANTSFVWSNGSTGTAITVAPTSNQTYSVTATLDGCTITSNTFAIKVNPLNTSPTIIADNAVICKGSSVILTASCLSVTDVFRWLSAPITNSTNLSNTNTRIVTEPGIYKGICEPPLGCPSAEVSVTISQGSDCNGQNFITVTPTKPVICPNSSVTLSATGCSGTLSWLGGASTQTGTSVTVSPTVTTTYLIQCSTGGSTSVDVVLATTNVIVNNNVTTGIERVKATETIESDKKVGDPNFTPSPTVTYEAGKAIILKPGFVAEKFTVFKAEIKTCN